MGASDTPPVKMGSCGHSTRNGDSCILCPNQTMYSVPLCGFMGIWFSPSVHTFSPKHNLTTRLNHSHIRWSSVVIEQIRIGLADILGADKFGKESELARLEPRQKRVTGQFLLCVETREILVDRVQKFRGKYRGSNSEEGSTQTHTTLVHRHKRRQARH